MGGPKVRYVTLDGHKSTAYLDHDEPNENGVFTGTNKHTDEDIIVVWTGKQWEQQSTNLKVEAQP